MAGGGHRSTLKQKNKSHNHGKHRSKRNLKREAHGKVNVKQLTKDKKIKDILRQEALQKRLDGRDDVLNDRRGATSTPPRLVVLVSLHASVNTSAAVDLIKEAELSADVNISDQLNIHISAGKLKKRICLIAPEYGNFQALLDAAKVADVLVFLVGDSGMDRYGEHCLASVIGQGVPAHAFVSQGLVNLSKKKLADAKKKIDKQIDKSFPGERVRPLDSWQDAQVLFRQLTNIALKPIHFRENRPYLLSEKVEFEPNVTEDPDASENTELGTLKLSGFLRGSELDVNQLVHLPGWGDFQMAQLDELEDPYPLIVKGNKDRRQRLDSTTNDQEMKDATSKTFRLAVATNPESLQSEVIPDAMDQEQTWPTSEELGEDRPAPKIKALKGVSDYQSNWILDLDDADEESDDSDAEQKDEEMEDRAKSNQESEESDADEQIGEDLDTATEADENANYDDGMDLDEEKTMYERMKEERLHVQFPDEVDTPLDTPARVRFARYRGMDSFLSTYWDPNEMLPYDYARIYRVSKHHFKRLRKISVKMQEDNEDNDCDNIQAEPGNFVTVYVKNVPKSFMDFHKIGTPAALFGLFKNEQKMTLVSAMISRMPGFKAPVKAKDPLIFQIGFRRFSTCPIFSEHAHQNKFKMERFLPQKGFIVASMYAPIMFAPAPVLVFRENVMQKYDLVAKGSLLPLDTDRIVIKRVVLSGAPFKINKKSVTVRYMFFNTEDIDFYKPIELRTKSGKRGHIKQSLGTHGHMKCTFNGQLKSEDTILMNLYKRVFPKWSFDPHVSILPPAMVEAGDDEQDKEEEVVEGAEKREGEAYQMFD
ncbi:pre-rRNA-processing protein tsr1 homolog [Plakobranchus ocellatus]|uniref:Pre-rRNA-processing protein TSR1 homolog n=1 Tax=Plakobranchus ocellatus TaxID=259542 RepID=A0AAV3YTH6_9GAST|nr:pre-rRNA-processing protein tsr1 homolog [Plakobranchus ocellatus]